MIPWPRSSGWEMAMMGPPVGRQDQLFYEFNLEERIPIQMIICCAGSTPFSI